MRVSDRTSLLIPSAAGGGEPTGKGITGSGRCGGQGQRGAVGLGRGGAGRCATIGIPRHCVRTGIELGVESSGGSHGHRIVQAPAAGRSVPAFEGMTSLDRRVTGSRCNTAGGYRGRDAAAPVHRAAIAPGVPGNGHGEAFVAIVTASITVAVPVILVVCGGVITVAAGHIHTMLRAGIGPVVVGPVMGFSGRINGFIALGAVGFIIVHFVII